ncbi:hypothetical protein [Thiorhodovibrio winogradskyi]|nr:hypothetical protein [Thiorhodovibrio winogradskyi]
MVPFRVEWSLITPMVAPTQPMHLDALLAWASVDQANGDIAAQEALPLARMTPVDAPERWVWKASRLRGDIVHRYQMPMFRAFEPWHWGEDFGRIYTSSKTTMTGGSGPYKSYKFLIEMIVVPRVMAWGVGDIDAVDQLLQRVRHLGRLRRLDCGRVGHCCVREDAVALEGWKERVLPVPEAGYYEVAQGIRPPYWDRHGHTRAYLPAGPLFPGLGETAAASGEQLMPRGCPDGRS